MIEITEEKDFQKVVDMIQGSLPANTSTILCKIVKKHKGDSTIGYKCTTDLYDFLKNIVQASDCKNDCQYDEISKKFLINGSLYYPPRKNYSIMDCIEISFSKES